MPPSNPDPRRSRLSKSRFTAGLQCHKQLWWRAHEPRSPELVPDAALQHRFNEGIEVGERARQYVPGGTLIDFPHDAYAARLAATQAALERGASAIYEATFIAGDVYVAVDVLERRGLSFGVIEVKSSTGVKPQHLPDVAIQLHVLRQSGLDVRRAEVMVLNRKCVYPELGNLFARVDVTADAEAILESVPGEVAAQVAMLRGPLPEVEIGPHCREPYECPFLARCWPRLPEHHVSTVYRAGKKAAEWEAAGFASIADLPAGLKLSAIGERQRRAVLAGEMIVEDGLGDALARFTSPLAFLDFETVAPALPRWNGCRPYDAVPVQFSCDVEEKGGRLRHHEHLAEGGGDPRPDLAGRLIEACRGASVVVAYNAAFERGRIEALAAALPHLKGPLENIAARLIDPLPVVRDHVYHPNFRGSFSLKSVLPALVPGLGYDDLAISDGDQASLELVRLLFAGDTLLPAERERLRAALLAYCGRDTLAMVKLLAALREIAASA